MTLKEKSFRIRQINLEYITKVEALKKKLKAETKALVERIDAQKIEKIRQELHSA